VLPGRSLLVDPSSQRDRGGVPEREKERERKRQIERERPTDVSPGRFCATWLVQDRRGWIEDGERATGLPGDRRRRLREDAANSQPLCTERGLLLRRAATGKRIIRDRERERERESERERERERKSNRSQLGNNEVRIRAGDRRMTSIDLFFLGRS